MDVQDSAGINTVSLNLGDTQIFDDVFRAYYAPLCHFASNFLKSDDDAKDLIEDLFLKLWQRKQSFENTQHAQSYLYRSYCDFFAINIIQIYKKLC